MTVFKKYRKKTVQEMRPYVPGETLPDWVSVSPADRENGSPKVGDMIARNPKDPEDFWLVSEDFFKENYVPAEEDGLSAYEKWCQIGGLLSTSEVLVEAAKDPDARVRAAVVQAMGMIVISDSLDYLGELLEAK